MSHFTRTDRSLLGQWWWTVDRMMLVTVLMLCGVGALLSLAAGPPMAQRMGYEAYHFVTRHLLFLLPAVAILLSVSILPVKYVRGLAVGILVLSFAGILATLYFGAEVNGAQRWLRIGPFALQPSEFLKPSLIVVCAWAFAERERCPGGLRFTILAIALYGFAAILLIMQPDIGQTILLTTVWAAVFFIAGIPFRWLAMMGGACLVALVVGYMSVSHVAERIDAFWNPAANDTHQVDMARNAFHNGGLWGQGPGEGMVKRRIPDAHTDFIFAVAAEEYGVFVCLLIIGLFGFIVVRGLAQALAEHDRFIQLAVSGLVSLVGLQAAINIGVNLQLLPAKGMTLPMISYGGSSMLAVALTFGMVLALTRRRPLPNLLPERWV